MRVLIVYAHHEPTSFNAAMTHEAREALVGAGHEVIVSDLYRAGFDPVSDRRNFRTVKDPTRLKRQDEEQHASQNNSFAPDLQAEMDKLAWCDVLVFQFPLWWLGLPAILKGWVDRVLAAGRAYGGGGYFGRGVFAGKRAMCSVTVGGAAPVYSGFGVYGPLESILHPVHHGILAFVGFTVIEPFVVYGPSRMTPDQRAAALVQYRERVLNLQSAPVLPTLDIERYEQLVLISRGDA